MKEEKTILRSESDGYGHDMVALSQQAGRQSLFLQSRQPTSSQKFKKKMHRKHFLYTLLSAGNENLNERKSEWWTQKT